MPSIYVLTGNVAPGIMSQKHLTYSVSFRIISSSIWPLQGTATCCKLEYKVVVVFRRKLCNVASRQAKASASYKTANINIQTSSDDEQPESILVCSPSSSPTGGEAPVTTVTNRGPNRKRQNSETKKMKLPSLLILANTVRRKGKVLKVKVIQIPLT